jgi:hypothetical protein
MGLWLRLSLRTLGSGDGLSLGTLGHGLALVGLPASAAGLSLSLKLSTWRPL